MVSPHHFPHWYPTAAYLYVLRLDALALAWEYLRRHPDYRLDWLHRHRRPQAAQHAAHRWGLRLLEDPALDARDAHPAWLPGHAGVVQLYPDADPPQNATAFAFWRIPGHKQLIHDGKRLVLIARSPGHCLRFALAPGLEDGMAVAYAHHGGAAAPARGHAPGAALANAAGYPALVMPFAGGGIPVGVQIAARVGCDRALLALGAQVCRHAAPGFGDALATSPGWSTNR